MKIDKTGTKNQRDSKILTKAQKDAEDAEVKWNKFWAKKARANNKNTEEYNRISAEIEALDSLISAKAIKLIERRNELRCYLR